MINSLLTNKINLVRQFTLCLAIAALVALIAVSFFGTSIPALSPVQAQQSQQGYLPPKSFEFEYGIRGTDSYFRGRLAVTPGYFVNEKNGEVRLFWFAGVSREKDFFKLEVLEGKAENGPRYLEQSIKDIRATFDTGASVSGKTPFPRSIHQIPTRATKLTRIDLDISVGGRGGDTTLTWPDLQINVSSANTANTTEKETEDCRKLRAEREQLQKEFDKLSKFVLPQDRIRELNIFLKEAIETLEGTESDTNNAIGKLDKIVELLERSKSRFAPFVKKLRDGLKKGVAKLTGVLNVLKKVQEYVELLEQIADTAENGTAGDLIRKLREIFDKAREDLPVDEVPGLKELFDLYSEALEKIADSSDKLNEHSRQLDEASKELFDGKRITVRPKSRREQHFDALARLEGKIKKLDEQIAETCGRETGDAPVDPCLSGLNRVNKALELAKKRAAKEEKQRDLAKHALDEARTKLVTLEFELEKIMNAQDKQAERARLEAEIKKANEEYQTSLFIRGKTERDWRDAVINWLKQEAEAQKWTMDDFQHLRICQPQFAF